MAEKFSSGPPADPPTIHVAYTPEEPAGRSPRPEPQRPLSRMEALGALPRSVHIAALVGILWIAGWAALVAIRVGLGGFLGMPLAELAVVTCALVLPPAVVWLIGRPHAVAAARPVERDESREGLADLAEARVSRMTATLARQA